MQSPPPSPTPESFHLWQTIGSALLGSALGVLGTLTTFRTRLALQDSAIAQVSIDKAREHDEIKASIAELAEDTEKRHSENQQAFRVALERADRRLDAILRIVAALARHNGTDQRFDDALLRLLADGDTKL